VGVAFVGVVAAVVAAEFLGAGMPFDLFFRFPVWLAAGAGAAGVGVMVLGAAGAAGAGAAAFGVAAFGAAGFGAAGAGVAAFGAAAFGVAAGLPKNLVSSLNMASWGAGLLDVE
jgi:hypothetical protein